jgi:hypothetical protein
MSWVDCRTGTWAENEDMKLKDAKQMHDGKNWDAIVALMVGRTKRQFSIRWILKIRHSKCISEPNNSRGESLYNN